MHALGNLGRLGALVADDVQRQRYRRHVRLDLRAERPRSPGRRTSAYTAGAANNAATAPYPWPDQVVEESTLGLWQCVVGGTSGGSAPSWTVSPNWPPNEPPNNYAQPYVTDGGVTWALVAYDDE